LCPKPRARRFEAIFRSLADVKGWMTRAQAARLWERAGSMDPGERIVEIGSYHGRSAIVLASSAPEGVQIICIDPHGGTDVGPWEYEGEAVEGQRDHEIYLANLERAGVLDRITHVRKLSQEAMDDVPGPVELLYIDGAHRFSLAWADLKVWSPKVAPGGVMLGWGGHPARHDGQHLPARVRCGRDPLARGPALRRQPLDEGRRAHHRLPGRGCHLPAGATRVRPELCRPADRRPAGRHTQRRRCTA